MQPLELQSALTTLISQWESEVVEFKEATDSFSTQDIGKYFSALSNEANLRGAESAWLVLGVSNKTRAVVGTAYREDTQRLMALKHDIAQGLEPSTTFKDIHVLHTIQAPYARVVLFQIPAAPRGMPIAWQGHYYGRNGESLASLSLNKLDEIRGQGAAEDWSAVACKGATLAHLDPIAMQRAREILAAQQQDKIRAQACLALSDSELLEKLELGNEHSISRAAMLLLGQSEASSLLSPFVAELVWKLDGPERAYELFSTPFLTTTSQLYQKIRNLRLSFLPTGQLIPIDIAKYDQSIVLEALHNCIAHQDYRACERVLVLERATELEFSNAGSFYDGQPLDYVLGSRTPRRYRNKVLAKAMVKLRMMDTMGFGIREVMFRGQAKRYLPLPDFDLSSPDHVTLKLAGRFIDENYSRALLANSAFVLSDILALDKVQKGVTPTAEELSILRKRKLVEGRKPALHISASVAAVTGEQSQYMRTSQQDDDHYRHLILSFVKKFGDVSKEQIRQMLEKKWPDGYTDAQRDNKIQNLLASFKKEGVLVKVGAFRNARWKVSV
jgi:ATP-dependent DNA helicase RecG